MRKWRSAEVWNVNGYSWTKDVDAIKCLSILILGRSSLKKRIATLHRKGVIAFCKPFGLSKHKEKKDEEDVVISFTRRVFGAVGFVF